MSESDPSVPPEIMHAYREAKARGLPDGWTCSIDKRHRRKWTAPNNGRSCDSIPKALQISVDLGLLPPDTKIETGKRKRTSGDSSSRKRSKEGRKRGRPPKASSPMPEAPDAEEAEEESDDQEEDDEGPLKPPPPPLDPEHSLDGRNHNTAPTTVHWDPKSVDGKKIGWKIRVALNSQTWADGRIVRYDPYTHKHKIQLQHNGRTHNVWIWIRNDQHSVHMATRMVWAHVKGFAWWPAMVMESNSYDPSHQLQIEFFGTGEVSTLRDSPESIRPFSPHQLDPIVAKHKKKRNARAYELACEEYQNIRKARNEAALFYAEKSLHLCDQKAPLQIVGRRVQIFRDDVNYPYGDTVVGKIRKYSGFQKKFLVSFEISEKTNNKYDATWLALTLRNTKLLGKRTAHAEVTPEALVPFLVGYNVDESDDYHKLLNDHCRGCVEVWKKTDTLRAVCDQCDSSYHLGCFDPPLQQEQYQKLIKDGVPLVCPQCTMCRGCYQKDSTFGSHQLSPIPKNLSFPANETLNVCLPCREAYEVERYCPNCAHTWDDVRFNEVRHQHDWYSSREGRKRKTELVEDTEYPLVMGGFSGDDKIPHGLKVHPSSYYPETTEFGMTEVEMLVCDSCGSWVHAGCTDVTEEEYEQISDGKHSIYGKEFLCRICCRKRCNDIIKALNEEDRTMLFAQPVSERDAPNYHDLIKRPMDLKTLEERAQAGEYLSYAWTREMFELMVMNALTFNRFYTAVWNEAKRFYHAGLKNVFQKLGKAAPPGVYDKAVQKLLKDGEEARRQEADRVQVDETVEKKDLVAGSMAITIDLPPLRTPLPDQTSCVPFLEVDVTTVDAFYNCWMDACFTCGSSGASDTMLFCVDCGEAFHAFCANVPIHSMSAEAVAGWRCPNCKICEISGEVPADDTQMIFCEMCDRGFSLGLLDPPLERAPPGLWVCGQCVDCQYCRSTSEPASLKYWSRHTDICFRCGGCEGFSSKEKCKVCSGLLRHDDTDFVECDTCSAKVHTACDQEAYDFLHTSASGKRVTRIKYSCPYCPRQISPDNLDADADRNLLLKIVRSSEDCSEQLVDSIIWKTHDMWRDEYIGIINTGIRMIEETRRDLGDPRFVAQQILADGADVCMSTIQRALRFCHVVKRRRVVERGCKPPSIEHSLLYAKMAASFIELACQVLGRSVNKEVVHYDRLLELLKPPSSQGVFMAPMDPLRYQPVSLSDDAITDVSISLHVRKADVAPASEATDLHHFKAATPLCGWSEQLGQGRNQSEWKDPRECCLCHICGDVDAGFPDEGPEDPPEDDIVFSPMGRLLPLKDGHWVHTACALWSSEVFEAPDDGLLHAVEKARSRGAQLKCFGCGRPGATVGCCKSNCPYNYHFTCAKVCGAVFTANQKVFCANHKMHATEIVTKESSEPMKSLIVAGEKRSTTNDAETGDREICLRVGALTVHSLGKIDLESDSFHSENYITPPGYVATRIFWSMKNPRTRTVYVLKVFKLPDGRAEFAIIPGDDPTSAIRANSFAAAYAQFMDRLRKLTFNCYSQGDLQSRLPMTRRSRKRTFGLNGPQFFGFGLDCIRKKLEAIQNVEAVVTPLSPNFTSYRFCFNQPDVESVMALQRKRAAAHAELALENSSGCARTEGIKAITRSGGSGRITRALVRSAEEVESNISSQSKRTEDRAKADRNAYQVKYKLMKSVPIEDRLAARRSHIHGWGLFTKIDVRKNDPITEYMGEIIRQTISDKRERAYEVSGEGSCYMFRLDLQRIVDATKIGSMARFMNHSCQSNAYAKIISVDTDQGMDQKIVVFASRDIAAGEEITYDYKFPVEDGSLKCTCGAPNCIGRLN